jgi:hypothetical protein
MATTFAGTLLALPEMPPIADAQTFALDAPTGTVRGFLVPLAAAFGGVFQATRENVRETFVTSAGYVDPSVGLSWFEHVHSVPGYLELGNIVTTIVSELELYNAYRRSSRELQTAVNNVGVGTDFVSLPTLPYDIAAQHSLIIQFRVATNGAPILDGTLVFTLDTETLTVPVTGTRVVMFPYLPETPLTEMLEFGTTVLVSANGKEQRVSYRKCPRQIFEMEIRVEDDALRRQLQTLLFGWQPGVFGVPVWFEARPLTADATAGDVTIQVDTQYADFRDGGLAIIWASETVYDALEVLSHTASSLTFTSALTQNFDGGTTLVMPLRTALTNSEVRVERYAVNMDKVPLTFNVLDNDVDLADTSAFSAYNSKVLLDEPNLMDGDTLPVALHQELLRLDNGAASLVQVADWLAPQTHTQKGFLCTSRQRLWEIRGLLHALRGQQVSFYLPTFYHDMVVASDISNGSSLMDIENIGYTRYINGQAPCNVVSVELANGTVHIKQILSSVVVSDSVERLTLSNTWSSSILAADVARVSYVKLARLSSDRITLEHSNTGVTNVMVPVVEVQQ